MAVSALRLIVAAAGVLGLPDGSKEAPAKPGKDVLVLKEGKRLPGTLLDITADEYILRTAEGKVFIARKDVTSIERDNDPGLAAFLKGTDAAAKSADEWRRLAQICGRQAALPEERECWRRVLSLAPDDPEAHGRLGEASLDGKWLREKEVEAKLAAGYRVEEGKLVRGPVTSVARDKQGTGAGPDDEKKPAAKAKGTKAQGAQTIRRVDLLAKVLDERDPHSLWMLLCRSGVRTAEINGREEEVTLKFAADILEGIARKKGEYRANMQAYLGKYGAPRDWEAWNKKRIDDFLAKNKSAMHLETRFYHILSTASKEVTQELGQKMDVVTAQVYHKIFEFEEGIPFKYVLIFWKDRGQFVQNGGTPMVAAYYRPDSKELVGYNLRADGGSGMDPFQTLFHEGWHQYFDFYIPNAPRWFDEGFAEVIYPTVVKGNQASWKGFNAGRSAVVGQAAAKHQLIPLRELIKMTRQDFYDPMRAGIAYAQAWSFIYFLTTYTNPSKKMQDRVRAFYKDYFWELHKGTDPAEAVDIVFRDVKFETLEAAWIEAIPRQK
jgi:hypothetical protein